jgi:hypothetical protein
LDPRSRRGEDRAGVVGRRPGLGKARDSTHRKRSARLRRAWAEPVLAGPSRENLADRLPFSLSKP